MTHTSYNDSSWTNVSHHFRSWGRDPQPAMVCLHFLLVSKFKNSKKSRDSTPYNLVFKLYWKIVNIIWIIIPSRVWIPDLVRLTRCQRDLSRRPGIFFMRLYFWSTRHKLILLVRFFARWPVADMGPYSIWFLKLPIVSKGKNIEKIFSDFQIFIAWAPK